MSSSTSSGFGSPSPSLRPQSRLVVPLLVLLIPATAIGLILFPFLFFFSLIPVLGLFSLPSLLALGIFLLYSLTFTLYLLLAQTDPPTNVSLPFLPLSPLRCMRITLYLFRLLHDLLEAGAIELWMDLQVRRVMVLGGKDAKTVLRENILYGAEAAGRRLDVYLPELQPGEGGGGEGGQGEGEGGMAPIVVLLGGGNWRWWRKQAGSQAALRLRRLGYVVVVPDIGQWPEAKSPQMVADMRRVLEWTHERARIYGGDPDKIFILGYGSGAHISLLTVIQEAVVNSRDEHLMQVARPMKGDNLLLADVEVSSGIRRCQIWGDEARLPPIAGLIFVSGVFDIIKQMRFEAKRGIEDVSSLRRACGPSTAATLLSCPSHLIFGAKEILDPGRLPPKILIIAGGKDVDVPYSQSVLLRTLLDGIGCGVKLKLYREETHLGSLAGLMHQTRYSSLILQEIEALISAPLVGM